MCTLHVRLLRSLTRSAAYEMTRYRLKNFPPRTRRASNVTRYRVASRREREREREGERCHYWDYRDAARCHAVLLINVVLDRTRSYARYAPTNAREIEWRFDRKSTRFLVSRGLSFSRRGRRGVAAESKRSHRHGRLSRAQRRSIYQTVTR